MVDYFVLKTHRNGVGSDSVKLERLRVYTTGNHRRSEYTHNERSFITIIL